MSWCTTLVSHVTKYSYVMLNNIFGLTVSTDISKSCVGKHSFVKRKNHTLIYVKGRQLSTNNNNVRLMVMYTYMFCTSYFVDKNNKTVYPLRIAKQNLRKISRNHYNRFGLILKSYHKHNLSFDTICFHFSMS